MQPKTPLLFRWFAASLMTLICILSANSLLAESKAKPNIILIMSDDQGWGQVGYNGHPHLKTPNLDEMAATGIRFNRFYSAASVCSPTRASVLTGRVPERTGVPGLHKRLCLQEKTLAQALKKAGYATAHFGKWHLNGVQGSAMPILPDDPNHPGHYGFDHWLSATNYIEMDPLMTLNGKFVALKGDSSVLMAEAAMDFIKSKKDQPIFAMLWYGSPHFPYRALPEDMENLSKDLDSRVANIFGEIQGMDRSIGIVRQGLRELGLADNTILWFCSDNGGRDHEPDSVGGLRGFKGSLYEGGIRVPGVIEWPGGIQKPLTTEFPATTLDMMPTVIDLLGLPQDSMLDVYDGESIAPLFDGKTPERTHAIPFTNKGTALIDGDYKLIKMGRGKGTFELYNLKQDPKESKNIAADFPERFEKMKAEAEKLMASVEASSLGADYPEGKIIQPQRSDRWSEMPAYHKHYETFQKLKPSWTPPTASKKKREKKPRDGKKRKKDKAA